jgi:hypothetical protein
MAKYEDTEASPRSTKDIVNCWYERNKNELKNNLPSVSGMRQRLLHVLMIGIGSLKLALGNVRGRTGRN